jgi:hypothetical protein
MKINGINASISKFTYYPTNKKPHEGGALWFKIILLSIVELTLSDYEIYHKIIEDLVEQTSFLDL